MDYEEKYEIDNYIAQAILHAVKKREESWEGRFKIYSKPIDNCCHEAAGFYNLPFSIGGLLSISLTTAWNDTIERAKEVLNGAKEKNKKER